MGRAEGGIGLNAKAERQNHRGQNHGKKRGGICLYDYARDYFAKSIKAKC
jgi:hypothetical protein